MHWQNGKFVVSQYENSNNSIHCPNCNARVEPLVKAAFVGLVCTEASCNTKVRITEIENVPEAVAAAFNEVLAANIDLEAMKEVVDELQSRGSVEIAAELSNVIVANTSSEHVATAERVEAVRLLNFVQAQAEQEPNVRHLAARLAMLKADLTRRK